MGKSGREGGGGGEGLFRVRRMNDVLGEELIMTRKE